MTRVEYTCCGHVDPYACTQGEEDDGVVHHQEVRATLCPACEFAPLQFPPGARVLLMPRRRRRERWGRRARP